MKRKVRFKTLRHLPTTLRKRNLPYKDIECKRGGFGNTDRRAAGAINFQTFYVYGDVRVWEYRAAVARSIPDLQLRLGRGSH